MFYKNVITVGDAPAISRPVPLLRAICVDRERGWLGGVVLGQSVDPEDGRWRPASRWENCQEIPKMEIPVGFGVELVYPFLGYVQAVRRLQGNLLTVKVEGGFPKLPPFPQLESTSWSG